MSEFKINTGDYIDRREFTQSEVRRFENTAGECGFNRMVTSFRFVMVDPGGNINATNNHGHEYLKNNIVTQFREFLDKEKGMSKFTKDDLKDGMRVINRANLERIVFNGRLYSVYGEKLLSESKLSDYEDNLLMLDCEDLDIMKVTDRDGTVLFEREPEAKEMTVADIERELGYSVKVIKG